MRTHMWTCLQWPENNLRCHLPVSYCDDVSYKPGTLHAGYTGWLNNSIFSRNEKTEGSWLLNPGCYVSHGVGLQIQVWLSFPLPPGTVTDFVLYWHSKLYSSFMAIIQVIQFRKSFRIITFWKLSLALMEICEAHDKLIIHRVFFWNEIDCMLYKTYTKQ